MSVPIFMIFKGMKKLDEEMAQKAKQHTHRRSAPTVAARTWHHTAMSVATFTLSALMGYIATEAIFKRIRGRN